MALCLEIEFFFFFLSWGHPSLKISLQMMPLLCKTSQGSSAVFCGVGLAPDKR